MLQSRLDLVFKAGNLDYNILAGSTALLAFSHSADAHSLQQRPETATSKPVLKQSQFHSVVRSTGL
jgi:hypothetical protein